MDAIIILSLLLGVSLCANAGLYGLWRFAKYTIKEMASISQADAAQVKTEHVVKFATLNEEFEQMRSRALLAERRVRSDEAPLKGAIRVRSASALRAMNDEENERIVREGAEKHANTSQR